MNRALPNMYAMDVIAATLALPCTMVDARLTTLLTANQAFQVCWTFFFQLDQFHYLNRLDFPFVDEQKSEKVPH